MKWIMFLLVMIGGYYFILMASTSMALDQMKHFQDQYTAIAEQADQISNGAQLSIR